MVYQHLLYFVYRRGGLFKVTQRYMLNTESEMFHKTLYIARDDKLLTCHFQQLFETYKGSQAEIPYLWKGLESCFHVSMIQKTPEVCSTSVFSQHVTRDIVTRGSKYKLGGNDN